MKYTLNLGYNTREAISLVFLKINLKNILAIMIAPLMGGPPFVARLAKFVPDPIILCYITSQPEEYESMTASGMLDVGLTSHLCRSLLPVVQVTLCNNAVNHRYTTLLDTGSEINIISYRCYRQMGLKGKTIYLNLVGAGGIMNSIRAKMVNVKIKDREGKEITIECIMLSQACGCVLNIDTSIIENCGRELLQNRNVYTKGGEVDLLIGMSMPELHKQLSFQRLQNGTVIMETRFGYCLVGSIQNRQTSNYKHGEYVANQISIVTEESEEFMFRDQLQAELAGINNNDSLKNEEEVQFEKRIKLDHDVQDNRFQVELP